MRRVREVWLGALGLAFVCGCVAQQEAGVHPQMRGLPDWVLKGGGAFPADKGKALYGVGSVSGVKNVSLARTTGGARARTEVARTLKTFVANVMKDYMKSAIAGDMTDAEEGQLIESVSKVITTTTLVGCEVLNRHYDQKSNTWYALARLGMDNVAMQLRKQVKQVEKTRKLKMEAAKAHEELDKIISERAHEMY